MANEVIAFKNAGLPNIDVGRWRQQLAAAQEATAVAGSPYLRLTKGTGEWVYGQKDTEVQPGSLWAINPLSFGMGFVAWKGGKPVGDRMSAIMREAPIDPNTLPDVGAEWDPQVSFDLVCLNGEDEGTSIVYKANSKGASKAFSELTGALQRQLGIDPSTTVPVVKLESEFYMHSQYGKTWNPIFTIVRWAPLSAQAPAVGAPAEAEKPKVAEGRAPVGETTKTVTDAVDLNANAEAVIREVAESAGQTVTPQRQRRRPAVG